MVERIVELRIPLTNFNFVFNLLYESKYGEPSIKLMTFIISEHHDSACCLVLLVDLLD